jgi:hypothetical protein
MLVGDVIVDENRDGAILVLEARFDVCHLIFWDL